MLERLFPSNEGDKSVVDRTSLDPVCHSLLRITGIGRVHRVMDVPASHEDSQNRPCGLYKAGLHLISRRKRSHTDGAVPMQWPFPMLDDCPASCLPELVESLVGSSEAIATNRPEMCRRRNVTGIPRRQLSSLSHFDDLSYDPLLHSHKGRRPY